MTAREIRACKGVNLQTVTPLAAEETSTYLENKFNAFWGVFFLSSLLFGDPSPPTMDLKAESKDLDYRQPAPIEVFASRSTLHGISHMFTYERMCIKRTLWTLFFLGSVGVLAMVCVDRVHFYFQYPHVTKLDEVAAPMMVFPSVTFCNLNSFRFSRVTRNDLYHAGELLALLNGRCVS